MTASAPGSTVMRAVSKPAYRLAAALALCCVLAPGAAVAAGPACDQAGKSAAPGRSGAAALFAMGCHDAALQHTQTLIDTAARDTPAQQKDLALALNDAGLGAARGAAGFKPLPAVPGELARIVRDARNPDGALPGRVLLDAAFNRGGLDEALLGSFNVVHIASHFDFRPGDPTRSVLLLGDGRTVSLRELAAMDYLSVQLLTLSACNTASGGGINENGAEVEGLAAAVRRQGARSVLASLWPVADASTAALMQHFYTSRAMGRARALRDAQLGLLRGGAAAGSGATERGAKVVGEPLPQELALDPARPWAHPYFWAPFTLSGDWL